MWPIVKNNVEKHMPQDIGKTRQYMKHFRTNSENFNTFNEKQMQTSYGD